MNRQLPPSGSKNKKAMETLRLNQSLSIVYYPKEDLRQIWIWQQPNKNECRESLGKLMSKEFSFSQKSVPHRLNLSPSSAFSLRYVGISPAISHPHTENKPMRKTFLTPVASAMAGTLRTIGEAFNSLASLCDARFLDRAATIPIEAETVDVLTFRDIVEWLTANRPAKPEAVRAVVLREQLEGLLKVTTVYLNSDGGLIVGPEGIPCGRAQRVRALDQELSEFFGNRSMVVFE